MSWRYLISNKYPMKSQDSYYVDLGIDFIHTNEIVDKVIEHNSVAGKP
jgi:hypothetical protein